MEPDQHKRLKETISAFTVIRLGALAERVDISEDGLLNVLTDKRILMFRRAGALWVRGRRPHWTVRDKTGDV